MRVLLTNIQLNGRTGTEIVIRDLALGLRAAGCEPAVYSPNPGCMSDEIAASGIRVVSSLEHLEFVPDVIHGHHHVETLTALHHFPSVPGIFVCHDAVNWHDFPPIHPRLRGYVAVDFNCRERLMREAFLAEKEVHVIGNAVDLNCFQPRSSLPDKPSRAVLFSNYAKLGDDWVEAVSSACEAEGVSLEVIGSGVGRSWERPEEMLGSFDLVFGKARCVIEALATGCAAIMCDARGLGEMVTRENVEHAMDWNFGARLLTRETAKESVQEEIRRYDPRAAQAVSVLIRQRRALYSAVEAYRLLYERVIRPSPIVNSFASRWTMRLQHQLNAHQSAIAQLENVARLRASLQPHMPRLNASDLSGIQLQVKPEVVPLQVQADQPFKIDCALVNGSCLTLSGGGILPLSFCHHWRSGTTGEMLIFENTRTLLPRPVLPGAASEVTIKVAAPAEAGFYHLEMTLVQDHVLWFDGLTPDFPVILPVIVRGPAASNVQPAEDRDQ